MGLQRTRAAVYLLACASAFLFRALGVLSLDVPEGLAIVTCGVSSAGLVSLCIARAPRLYAALDVTSLWILADAALVTWGVAASGGIESPWYLWYLAVAGAGAFAAGRRGALLASLANTAAYFTTLALMGQIGFFDQPCLVALARIAFLHGAGLFFLRGVADLAERRLEIKRMRDEDARRLADLERLAAALDQRTRELSAANRRISEADRQKSRFLANVSHELRTPLNSILGFSQILATRFPGELGDKPRRFVSNIQTSGVHLLKVLDDVLDLSKIEAGRMALAPERVDVRTLADEALAAVRGEADPRRIALEPSVREGLPPLEADPLKLKQMLLNLLTNAIHFSSDGATVTLGAELLPKGLSPLGVESIRLWVRDQGAGIDPEDQAIVFDEFRQARHRARSGGTGLGLALVKSLAALHGGDVGLESAPGCGSRFHVDLPVRFRGDREARRDESSSGEVPVVTSSRVLLVSESDVSDLQNAIERTNSIALAVRPGNDAVRLSRTLHPAAVVVSVDGPESWDVLRRLRSDPETRQITAVLCAMPGEGGGAALTADDLAFAPLRDGAVVPAGVEDCRWLVWGRDPGPLPPGARVVSTADEANAFCVERVPDVALLDLSADGEVLAFALELSRRAAETGLPLLRLFVPSREAEARLTSRLTLLAVTCREPAEAIASRVDAVARRACARVS